MELFNTPETETGELRISDCWVHTPAAWIPFHHVPRRTVYVPDETGVPHDQLGSYPLICSTKLGLTKTESYLWINGTLTKVEMLDSSGLD